MRVLIVSAAVVGVGALKTQTQTERSERSESTNGQFPMMGWGVPAAMGMGFGYNPMGYGYGYPPPVGANFMQRPPQQPYGQPYGQAYGQPQYVQQQQQQLLQPQQPQQQKVNAASYPGQEAPTSIINLLDNVRKAVAPTAADLEVSRSSSAALVCVSQLEVDHSARLAGTASPVQCLKDKGPRAWNKMAATCNERKLDCALRSQYLSKIITAIKGPVYDAEALTQNLQFVTTWLRGSFDAGTLFQYKDFKMAFWAFDTTRPKGYLSPQEFQGAFRELPPNQCATLFTLVDANTDNQVSRAELGTFLKAIYNFVKVAPEALLPANVLNDQNLNDQELVSWFDPLTSWLGMAEVDELEKVQAIPATNLAYR